MRSRNDTYGFNSPHVRFKIEGGTSVNKGIKSESEISIKRQYLVNWLQYWHSKAIVLLFSHIQLCFYRCNAMCLHQKMCPSFRCDCRSKHQIHKYNMLCAQGSYIFLQSLEKPTFHVLSLCTGTQVICIEARQLHKNHNNWPYTVAKLLNAQTTDPYYVI